MPVVGFHWESQLLWHAIRAQPDGVT